MIDISKLAAGDVITAKLFVVEVGDGYVMAGQSSDYGRLYLDANDILSHAPAKPPLKVGDLVKSSSGDSFTWRVAAIDDGHVWLRSGSLSVLSFLLCVEKWERVPP